MRHIKVEEAGVEAKAISKKQDERAAAEAVAHQAAEAQHSAITANMMRLRELRLAKDEADRLAAKAAGLDDGNKPKRGPEPRIKHAVVNGRLMRYTTKVRQVAVALAVTQQPNRTWLARGHYEGHTLEATAQTATAAVKRWQEIAEFRSGGPGHRRFAGFLKPDGKP